MIYFSLLFLVVLINLYGIIQSLQIKELFPRLIFIVLFVFCSLRYITVYIFAAAESPLNLYIIKHLVLTSFVSIPILSFLSIQFMNKGAFNLFDKSFTAVLAAINILIFYKAPIGIESAVMGYRVILNSDWHFIALIIQGCFAAFMIYLSLSYFLKVKDLLYRTINGLICLGFAISALEEILTILNRELMPEPIISEGIILFSIILVFKTLHKNEAN